MKIHLLGCHTILTNVLEYSAIIFRLIYHIYHLFSFCGSLQDYKIHKDMEIVNTVHKSNKIICLKSQEVMSV